MIKYISIEYCGMWNYLPKAASLAESIKDRFQLETELIEGSGGVFEVEINGNLVFSKKKEKRFPTHEEIFTSIESIA